MSAAVQAADYRISIHADKKAVVCCFGCLQGNSPRAPRSSIASRHHPLSSQGSLPSAASAASSSSSLALPCFLPVPESQPVLPALLRRLLQQGALPEALALAKRHEGGPHFKRSLEWLLFTTLDMEGSKCKPGKVAAAAATAGSSGGWPQQPLHVLQGGMIAAGAAVGVLGRQGKVGRFCTPNHWVVLS